MNRTLTPVLAALVVLLIELVTTYGAAVGEPFAPVAGWAPTRPIDTIAYGLVIAGCGALGLLGRLPFTGSTLATGAYILFALRGYELGMFLAPMFAVFALVATRRSRLAATACALAGLAAGLIWVANRTGPITDPGVALLAWVAFGVVLAVFFLGPLVLGEVVRLRSLLSPSATPAGRVRGRHDRAHPQDGQVGDRWW